MKQPVCIDGTLINQVKEQAFPILPSLPETSICGDQLVEGVNTTRASIVVRDYKWPADLYHLVDTIDLYIPSNHVVLVAKVYV